LQSLGATPELLWRFPTTNSVYDLPRTSPAVGADGTIYFSSSSNLFAIRPDGTLKWAISQGLVAFSPVVGADGTVYAYFGAGVPNFTGITNTLHALTPAGQIRWQRTEFN